MLKIELRDDANDNYREVIEFSMSIDDEIILTDERFYGTKSFDFAYERLMSNITKYRLSHNIDLPYDWYIGHVEAK